MFDLPEPFGPTTTATPGSRRTSTGSTNDLKPRSRIVFRCTRGVCRAKRTGRVPSGRPDGLRQAGSAPPGRRLGGRGDLECLERLPRGLLLGILLRGASPRAEPARRRRAPPTVKIRSCAGPSGREQRVGDRLAAPRDLLLQLGLVVDVVGERVVDAAREGLDDRRRRPPRSRARGRPPRSPPRAAPRGRCDWPRAARRRRPRGRDGRRRGAPRARAPRR